MGHSTAGFRLRMPDIINKLGKQERSNKTLEHHAETAFFFSPDGYVKMQLPCSLFNAVSNSLASFCGFKLCNKHNFTR